MNFSAAFFLRAFSRRCTIECCLIPNCSGCFSFSRPEESVAKLPVGLFGASTGAAAALVAAAKLPHRIGAVVSRGGGASHLFPEPGAMETVIASAAGWFERHLVMVNASPIAAKMTQKSSTKLNRIPRPRLELASLPTP
jgi:pimeloyl-ACP methyl ester carboxylesterase